VSDGPEPDDRSPTRSARRRAREFALQGLYQWLVAQTDVAMIEAQIVVLPEFERSDTDLFRSILRGVIQEAATLHQTIVPLIDRPLIQLSPVEHAAILIGAWEFSHAPETPYRVVINEAVEIAKSFGGTDGYRYVNGVLDKVAARLRPTERPNGRV
jgi:N utilization substance protein B